MSTRQQIVYVLSTNYAGSHYLTLMLGANTNCISVGELHNFGETKKHKKSCYICENDAFCPIFKNITFGKTKNIYDIIFTNLQEFDPKCTTLIDNSKKTTWTKEHLHVSYPKKYIHLIRDPRALIRRWFLTYKTQEEKKKVRFIMARRSFYKFLNIAFGSELNTYIHKWLYQNTLITNFLKANHLDHKVITYHNLVKNKETEIKNIMDWTGNDFEPEQLSYWKFTHHGTQKPEYQHINDQYSEYFDLRWKEFLTEKQQAEILSNKHLKKYLDSLNLAFEDEGLYVM